MPQIGNLDQLHHLNLTSTNFDGVLPVAIENCSNLGQLHISDCNFTGAIPAEICNTPIFDANFEGNNFDLSSCPAIECLIVDNNVNFFGNFAQIQQSGFSLTAGCGFNPNPCSIQDSLALVALYNATDGPNWNNKESWLTGPVFTWFGIYVENGRVRNINTGWNNLNGTLPSEFF